MMAGKLGIGAFAGVGGASQNDVSLLHVPAGASVSWRTRLGERRGISFYAAPFYSWTRVSFDDESDSKGLLRASFGVDVAVVPSLGITVGYELGQTADEGEPGATGGTFGVGVSYALRRGQ
jgi:opacity protein-like surface antigen